MVARKSIPDEHHVMRYCQPRLHQLDGEGRFIAIIPQAFELRPDDGGNLSVTWIEYFGPYDLASKSKAAKAFQSSLTSGKLGKKGVFATAQVKMITETRAHGTKALRVVHDPVPTNLGHAEIRQFSDDDIRLLEYLATEVFAEIDHVKDLGLH
ncbi:MAG: hypothetical protein RL145_284 [Pseudomonadota bacterium]